MSEFLNNNPAGYDNEGNSTDRQKIGFKKPTKKECALKEKLHELNSFRSRMLIKDMERQEFLEANGE